MNNIKTVTPAEVKNFPAEELELVSMIYDNGDDGHGHNDIEAVIFNHELHNSTDFPEDSNKCNCCGSTRLKYACEVVHKPTGTGFWVGRTCAFKIEGLTKGNTLRTVDLKRRSDAKRKLNTWVAEHPEHEEVLIWANGATAHHIARDMASKLTRYGSISDKAINFMYKLWDDTKKREENDAIYAPKEHAPEGRVEVEGEVLCVKEKFGHYGISYKMLVRLSSTFAKVWTSVPKAILEDTKRGSKVKFTATFKRSDDDKFFAFGSRPSKATLISA